MPTENEQQTIENGNTRASDELLELKKDLANQIVDKILEKDSNLFSVLFKGSMSDYLIDENTVGDALHDEIMVGGLGKPVGLITPALKRYREMLSKATTKEDLENLKTTIFNEIGAATTSSTETTTSTTEKSKVGDGKSYEIDHFDISVSPETKKLWENLKGKEKPDLEPFACAMKAYKTEKEKGNLKNTKYITIVDFTKNQLTNNRFFVINLETNTIEYAEKCGHGCKSGDKERATSFSNIKGSNQSSLGAYITKDHSDQSSKKWHGNFPQGQEKSNNASRGIAIHPVKSLIFSNSGKPTSEGCFTIPASQDYVDEILGKIEGKSLVFSYAKSKNYFAQSNYFQQDSSGRYAA